MKPTSALAAIALVASAILLLAGCGKTNTSSNTNAVASVCTTNAYGQSVDQYGRPCNYNSANACLNVRYDMNTRQYVSLTTGQPVPGCGNGYYDGYNSVPYYASYGGQNLQGCSIYTPYTGAQYVPVDLGSGQLICMNSAYLAQYNPGYNWNQMCQYQVPIYTCGSANCMGGGYYGGYNYGCNSGFNMGIFTPYFGFAFGTGGGACGAGW